MNNNIRLNGKNILKIFVTNQKTCDKLENIIYNMINNNEDEYNDIIYEVYGKLLNKNDINDIISNLENKQIKWLNPYFHNIRNKQSEQDDFIENPFEVEEGVLECKKCGSRRVFSYGKQVRSGDEATTTFAQCIECKSKWTENH
jgi:DNA-directed RNA polymerase subunit M/transcription elongation factor TFIIS